MSDILITAIIYERIIYTHKKYSSGDWRFDAKNSVSSLDSMFPSEL